MKKLMVVLTVPAVPLILVPAASAQIYVKNGGKLGIGDFETTNPLQPLHLKKAGAPVTFYFEETVAGNIWSFKIASTGKFSIAKIGSGNPAELILASVGTNGKVLDINGRIEATSFDVASSRELKEGFVPVSPSDVLAKVAEMPISRWNYTDDKSDTAFIGPMAEDFHAAFQTASDANISLTDVSGVALAAIQGLHQQAQEKDQLINELMSRIEKLEQQLAQ